MSRTSLIAEIIGLFATHGDVDILRDALHAATVGNLQDADAALSTFYEVTYA
jgi:hypothetical protein